MTKGNSIWYSLATPAERLVACLGLFCIVVLFTLYNSYTGPTLEPSDESWGLAIGSIGLMIWVLGSVGYKFVILVHETNHSYVGWAAMFGLCLTFLGAAMVAGGTGETSGSWLYRMTAIVATVGNIMADLWLLLRRPQ